MRYRQIYVVTKTTTVDGNIKNPMEVSSLVFDTSAEAIEKKNNIFNNKINKIFENKIGHLELEACNEERFASIIYSIDDESKIRVVISIDSTPVKLD